TYRFANYFGGSSALSVNGSPSATAQWGTIALEILPATTPTPTPTATFTPTPTPTPTASPTATATPSATSTPTPTPTPTPTCNPPSVTTNPSNQTVTYGVASVSFTAAASGNPAPTVQWQVSTGGPFSDIPGATSTTYTINNPTVSLSGNQYRAVFTNTCNGTQTATTSAATLTVNKANATVVVTPYTCPSTTYTG